MTLTHRVDRRAVGAGAAAGVAAAVLGYLVVYVTQREAVVTRLRTLNVLAELLGGEPIPARTAVGWLFYNAHFVATAVPGFGGTRTVNFVAATDDPSLAFLYLLPPLLLLAAGAAVAHLAAARTPTAGAGAGALVAAGYLPLAVAGVLAFRYPVGGGAIAPDPVTAVLLAGLVYPLAFGAVGGAAAGAVAE